MNSDRGFTYSLLHMYEILKDKDFVYLMASPIGDTASFLPIQKTESMPLIKN